jgi:hypothetical protein
MFWLLIPEPYVIGKVLPFDVTVILANGVTVPVTTKVLLTVSPKTGVLRRNNVPNATLEADKTPFEVVGIALKYLFLNLIEKARRYATQQLCLIT